MHYYRLVVPKLTIRKASDTTATTLSALFFYLSQHSNVYRKLADEIRSTFATCESIHAGPDLTGCSYLRACIDEALRINPPIPSALWRQQTTSRHSTKGDVDQEPVIIDGHVISPGTEVGVNAWALHHNEEYFSNPFQFNPERWLSKAPENDTNKCAFIPFSIGPRGCAGKAMAYLEISLVVAKTVWCFDLEKAPSSSGCAFDQYSQLEEQRTREYPMGDCFTASHSGPYLRVHPRTEWVREMGKVV